MTGAWPVVKHPSKELKRILWRLLPHPHLHLILLENSGDQEQINFLFSLLATRATERHPASKQRIAIRNQQQPWTAKSVVAALLRAGLFNGFIKRHRREFVGRLVPGAASVLQGLGTNDVHTATTRGAGSSVISFLNPAIYSLSVSTFGTTANASGPRQIEIRANLQF